MGDFGISELTGINVQAVRRWLAETAIARAREALR
jgi:hypothetical protein